MVSDLLNIYFWQTIFKAAGFSLGRLLATYLICLVISLIIAIWLASSQKAEKIAVPVFDLVQNIPPLAFYPVAALLFIKTGLIEGAAVFVLFTVMLWPLLFGLIGAVRQIPGDIKYAARIFGANGLKYVSYIILPAVFPVIVTSSIVSWGIGWNLLVVAEWIRYGRTSLQLQGLGGLLNKAASGVMVDIPLFVVTLLIILLLVFLIHYFIWRPLLRVSEHYRFD
jgi:NitT/TauT family transport system permease protein